MFILSGWLSVSYTTYSDPYRRFLLVLMRIFFIYKLTSWSGEPPGVFYVFKLRNVGKRKGCCQLGPKLTKYTAY
jgi:hypothetical protein